MSLLPAYSLLLLLTIPYNIYYYQKNNREEKYSYYIYIAKGHILWIILILIGKFLL
jgi:hypothetical protein